MDDIERVLMTVIYTMVYNATNTALCLNDDCGANAAQTAYRMIESQKGVEKKDKTITKVRNMYHHKQQVWIPK